MSTTDETFAEELASAASVLARLASAPRPLPGGQVLPLRPVAQASAAQDLDAADVARYAWAQGALAQVATYAAEAARLVAAPQPAMVDSAEYVARVLASAVLVAHRRAGGPAQACSELEALLWYWDWPPAPQAEPLPVDVPADAHRAQEHAASPQPERDELAPLLIKVFAGLAQRAGLLLELVQQAQEGQRHAPHSARVMAQAIGAEADLALRALGGVPVRSAEPAQWLFGERASALQALAAARPAASALPGKAV